MIVCAIQTNLSESERGLIERLVDTAAREQRLQVKLHPLSRIASLSEDKAITTLLSVGDTLWHTRFLGAASPLLRGNHDLVLAQITPRTTKIPIPRLREAALQRQIKSEMQIIAARKIAKMPVYSCGPYLFLRSLELTSHQTLTTRVHITAGLGKSTYQLTCPGSHIRLHPYDQPNNEAAPSLQLHILQGTTTKPTADNAILSIVKDAIPLQNQLEDVLHIPISQAEIRSESELHFEHNNEQRIGRHFKIETLPWQLRVITPKSSPKDID